MTEQFHYEHNGVKFTLPYITNVKSGLMTDFLEALDEINEKSSKAYKVNKALYAIAAKESVEGYEALRDMTDEELGKFIVAWQESTPGVSGK